MAFGKDAITRALAAEDLLFQIYHASEETGDYTRADVLEGFYCDIYRLRILGARGTIRVGSTPDGRDIIEEVDSADLDMIVGNALAYLGKELPSPSFVNQL